MRFFKVDVFVNIMTYLQLQAAKNTDLYGELALIFGLLLMPYRAWTTERAFADPRLINIPVETWPLSALRCFENPETQSQQALSLRRESTSRHFRYKNKKKYNFGPWCVISEQLNADVEV